VAGLTLSQNEEMCMYNARRKLRGIGTKEKYIYDMGGYTLLWLFFTVYKCPCLNGEETHYSERSLLSYCFQWNNGRGTMVH
jgi:hypothetical protein